MEKVVTLKTQDDLAEFLYALYVLGKKDVAIYFGDLTGCQCGCSGNWVHKRELWGMRYMAQTLLSKLPLEFRLRKTAVVEGKTTEHWVSSTKNKLGFRIIVER